MADGDKELDVVVPGEGEETSTTETTETKSYEEQLAELKAERDRERQGRLDAERRAHDAGGRVAQSEEEVRKSHITTMASALEVLKGQRDQLKANYAAAMAEGDFAKASEYNDATIEVVQQMSEISRGKLMAETTPVPRRAPPRTDTPHADPVVEGVASALTPLSANWVRAHPEYARDLKLLNKMKAAHYKIVAEMGEDKAETPEYFSAVEAELGVGKPTGKTNGGGTGHIDVAVSDAAKPVQTRQSGTGEREIQPPPAPTGAGAPRTRTIRLTPEQQDAAKISGLSNEEYAANLVKEKAAGTIGKDRVH